MSGWGWPELIVILVVAMLLIGPSVVMLLVGILLVRKERSRGWQSAAVVYPASWYPDPTGQHELRYWDGAVWTQDVSDEGVQAVGGSV